MTEWWTYRPSDFLMFAPRTYHRLFELANVELWPLHLLLSAAGAAIGLALVLRWPHAARAASALLGVLWSWLGWAFLWQRYAPINWAASGFAIAFALEGVLLLGFAVLAGEPGSASRGARSRQVGLGLWWFALVLHPAIAPLLGRPWLQSEWFGIAPDPTVLATLGLLLLVGPLGRSPPRGARAVGVLLWAVPLLWCVISGTTLAVMASLQAGLLPAAGLLALYAARRMRR